MAEDFTATVAIDVTGAEDIAALNEELANTTEGADEAGLSFNDLAVGVTAGIAAFAALKEAALAVASAVSDMSAEFERQAGIMNRFTGDIEEARRRTNGLTSDIDLMTAAALAQQAGLELTGSQFADLAVAANEFAAATGGDATAGMERLVNALVSGQSRGLRPFGISIDGVTGLANQQRAALEQLTVRYGDMESSADTLGGEILNLNVALDNAETEMFDRRRCRHKRSRWQAFA